MRRDREVRTCVFNVVSWSLPNVGRIFGQVTVSLCTPSHEAKRRGNNIFILKKQNFGVGREHRMGVVCVQVTRLTCTSRSETPFSSTLWRPSFTAEPRLSRSAVDSTNSFSSVIKMGNFCSMSTGRGLNVVMMFFLSRFAV